MLHKIRRAHLGWPPCVKALHQNIKMFFRTVYQALQKSQKSLPCQYLSKKRDRLCWL